jgi:hypothetical protein
MAKVPYGTMAGARELGKDEGRHFLSATVVGCAVLSALPPSAFPRLTESPASRQQPTHPTTGTMTLYDAVASMGLAGASALIAVNFTHPIETWKTRLQVDPKFSVRQMVRTEGPSSLMKGIQAAWLREASYTSIKLGAYKPIRDLLGESKDASFFLKFVSGSLVRRCY